MTAAERQRRCRARGKGRHRGRRPTRAEVQALLRPAETPVPAAMAAAPAAPGPLATGLRVSDDRLIVTLADGREVSVPLSWFPRLLSATPEQRAHWRLIGGGIGIHWPDVDEDISVDSLLASR